MIHLSIFVPLVVGGAVAAVWRDYKQKKNIKNELLILEDSSDVVTSEVSPDLVLKQFDDMGELSHYQRSSYYSLAFATAGAWFYAPAGLLAVPLVGYNCFHFGKMLANSDSRDRKSPLTMFESIGVGGTLLTGHSLLGSLVLSGSFTMRKLLLQGSNMAHIGPEVLMAMRNAHTWVLREGIEVEILVSELQKGDVFVLHEGDIVATEGVIIEGSGVVRQYSLRREMKSIHKDVGDGVFPFTRVEEGCLYVRS